MGGGEGWLWGTPLPVIPAKCRGGHWSADGYSQATVFSVFGIGRGFGMLQEPLILRQPVDSIHSCVFPGVPEGWGLLLSTGFLWSSKIVMEGLKKKKYGKSY